MSDLFETSGAHFSLDRKYRYYLYRIWDYSKPKILFIGLNPSTANENEDDPTIRRVKRFAKDWGYGGVYMMNLFAFVTPYPEELKKCENPQGSNDYWLDAISKRCDHILFAWGSFPEASERAKEVVAYFKQGLALRVNKDGSPAHPLYIPASTVPVVYSSNQQIE